MSDIPRLVAWRRQLLDAHDRLRLALAAAQEAARASEDIPDASRDLLLFCHGFCAALDGHHRGEDALLFPAVVTQHPDAARIVTKLRQDHDMMATLLARFDVVVRSAEPPTALAQHLQGLAAIMESHFRFEERELEPLLDQLELHADPEEVIGPL
ncbi:hemerythrin domain-containing protein [Microbacterium invictum]|uniref:Iron-sulfur cluster repair protein YtfE (RIC family) n=1 Tax=Microbacterium invictum TaxID=515415 RepID=A0AA40SQJ1_9MICO|nr:hemerythrin domain-containing protein [Microbacterium invictum]MBB4140543.1 iron-sulfur cluster repair protein YtfE (RIC family) [Microbacterium invictum]